MFHGFHDVNFMNLISSNYIEGNNQTYYQYKGVFLYNAFKCQLLPITIIPTLKKI